MMRNVFLVLAFIFCGVVAAGAQVPSKHAVAAQPSVAAWMQCVTAAARRFATSPDSAEFITKVALRSCNDEKQAVSTALDKSGLKSAVVKQTMNLLEEDAAHAAAVAVLEVRASR